MNSIENESPDQTDERPTYGIDVAKPLQMWSAIAQFGQAQLCSPSDAV